MPALEMKNIVKNYGGVQALNRVDLVLEHGEILGLVGENGAGKSTLMKILSGAVSFDSGEVLVDGKEISITSPQAAIRAGITVIYQELNMAKDLSVAENVFLGAYPLKNGVIDWKTMREETKRLLGQLHTDINPNEPVGDLKIAQQQFVEIAKALKNNSKIIVFDEPSAVLGKSDSEVLLKLIRNLKSQGVSVIYISHRLDEILELTDSIVIFRDGTNVCQDRTENFTMERLVSEMTGRDLKDMWPPVAPIDEDAPVVMEVRNLNYAKNRLHDVNFSVRRGEILGLAGLVGSGRTEIMRCVFGIDKADSIELFLNGKPVRIRSPREAIKQKLAYVTEDRKNLGLILDRAISENITLTMLKNYVRFLFINRKNETKRVLELKESLQIKTDNISNPVKSLSGGNQQKVVLAKWLHIDPDILILDEPTRGVDVGAKAEIYTIIEHLRSQGKTIILISSEFQEIIGLSTRIVVVKDGTTVKSLTREQAQNDSGLLEALS